MNKNIYIGCENAAQAMYKVEVYKMYDYKDKTIYYFGDYEEGKRFAESYFDTYGYDGTTDYQEEYRMTKGGSWNEIDY